MQQSKCKNGYNASCLTLVFMFGAIVGILTSNYGEASLTRNITVVTIATIAFHLTHNQPRWLSKFFNRVS